MIIIITCIALPTIFFKLSPKSRNVETKVVKFHSLYIFVNTNMVPLSVSLHICTNNLWATLPPGRSGFFASLWSHWAIRKCILCCCHSFIRWTNADSAPSTCQGFSQAGGTAVNTGSLFESHPCLVPLWPWEWFSSEPSSSQLQNAGKCNLPKRWLWKLAMLARVQWWGPGGILGALSKCWCLNPAPLQAWAAPAPSTTLDLASAGETQPSTHMPGCLDNSSSTGKKRD